MFVVLPISKEPRLARAMKRLLEQPASAVGFAQVAKEAGASPRTLARLFVQETGMTFRQWRTRSIRSNLGVPPGRYAVRTLPPPGRRTKAPAPG